MPSVIYWPAPKSEAVLRREKQELFDMEMESMMDSSRASLKELWGEPLTERERCAKPMVDHYPRSHVLTIGGFEGLVSARFEATAIRLLFDLGEVTLDELLEAEPIPLGVNPAIVKPIMMGFVEMQLVKIANGRAYRPWKEGERVQGVFRMRRIESCKERAAARLQELIGKIY